MLKRRFYRLVQPHSFEFDEYVIPAVGESSMLDIRVVGGNSSESSLTAIEIYWKYNQPGQELLFTTHGDGVLTDFDRIFNGNGVDKLGIVLRNDQGNEDTLGGYWEAIELGD